MPRRYFVGKRTGNGEYSGSGGGEHVGSGLADALQLSSGSFPRPLTEEEERYYLDLAGKGDLEARNVLIERNLRLVAHIMKN